MRVLLVVAFIAVAGWPFIAQSQPLILPVEADTCLDLGFAGNVECDPAAPELRVRAHDVDPRNTIVLVRFDLSRLPAEPPIDLALFHIRASEARSLTGSFRVFYVCPTKSLWEPGTLTGTDWPRCDTQLLVAPPEEPGWQAWDITSIVREWQSGAPNYGVKIGTYHGVGDHLYYRFESSESSSPPRLAVYAAGTGPWIPTAVPTATSTRELPSVTPTPTTSATATATATAVLSATATTTPTASLEPGPATCAVTTGVVPTALCLPIALQCLDQRK